MSLRRTNKWWWFGVVTIVVGLIANITSHNMAAVGWGIAAFAWMACAEMMRQQNERQQEFVDALLQENTLLRLDRKLRP